MSKNYLSEREGQISFFDKFAITDTELVDNTDGVYKGTIFEFKKSISNINTVLFQAIKYLSHRRIKGENVTANILLVALNEEVAYLFKSADYLSEIETVYAGAASKNNADFSARTSPETIHYDSPEGIGRITQVIADESFTKIHIDVFDVVGWAERFYRENPSASKIKLFEELRTPQAFEDLIHPWTGDEKDFKYIMDLLNDTRHKKELGAFYTPAAYCLKATELVRKAIAQVPKSNDYIILDRCAGTGNLEEFLTDRPVDDILLHELDKYIGADFKKHYLVSVGDGIDLILTRGGRAMNDITLGDLKKYETNIKIREHLFDDELSHTFVNTYELKEWIVLNERIGDKVKMIIPPPDEIDSREPLVNGGDALSERFIHGRATVSMSREYSDAIHTLTTYVEDVSTNVILYENPPFRDETSNSHMKGGSSSAYAKEAMRKEIKGATLNDLSNQFIWSGWKYYLTKPNDCYILFSPIKYWKSSGLSNKKFIDGYIFNRRHFHVNTASAIACILWKNEAEDRESITLGVWDIENNASGNLLSKIALDTKRKVEVKKVYTNLSKLYDKREDLSDVTDGIVCGLNGTEDRDRSSRVTKRFNKNIIGYLVTQQFGFENPRLATNLTRCAIYNGNGFFLRIDNFMDKLPLFAAGKMPIEKTWWLNGVVFKTADGGAAYTKDPNFLKACLIFSCLTYFNKCRSLIGSDQRFYKNELCFDKDTIASNELATHILTPEEQDLVDAFNVVLQQAKTTKNFNQTYTYGTYQIDKELNTRYKNNNDEWIYDYPELNTAINSLKIKLAKYYESVIQPKLFAYELLK